MASQRLVYKGEPGLLEPSELSQDTVGFVQQNKGKSLNYNELPPELQKVGNATKSVLTAYDKHRIDTLASKYYADGVTFEDPFVKLTNSTDLAKYLYYSTALPYKDRYIAEHAVRLRMSEPYKSRYKYPELQNDVVMEVDLYTRYDLPKTNTILDWTYPPYIPFYLTVTLNIDPHSGKIVKEHHKWLNLPLGVPSWMRWLIGSTAVTAVKMAEGVVGHPN